MKEKTLIIFGGSGYIGRKILAVFLDQNVFSKYIVCDINALKGFEKRNNVEFKNIDVRKEINIDLVDFDANSSWVFNLAAIHREPGHEYKEYFDTNIPGAENVSNFARLHGIQNIFFTSSIAPYGKALTKTSEQSKLYPETAYGISKLMAELIHREWLAENIERRLIIVRPSVIFGPKDPGNVYRMIKALKKGTFILPNGGDAIKAYGYVYGLVDSILFTMGKTGKLIVYNYAENPLVPLNEMTDIIKKEFGYKKPTLKLSTKILYILAMVLQMGSKIAGKKSDIHPVRVRKAGFSTNIEPKYLRDNGFVFKYDLLKALRHWKSVSPEDF
ncbi:NAD-dependent epimerase/dehydratase family protein [Maribacter sp. R77961]|uniref:NAD-dependent epimerase/dehydratase family protein n=1 Tax=Maribacter sp. R77961 TaxID=3093871 RepID=UPI0037C65663